MCSVCGCSSGNTKIGGKDLNHSHDNNHDHDHNHDHNHTHDQNHSGSHDHSHEIEQVQHSHVAEVTQERMISLERDIMSKNDQYAYNNREIFQRKGILALNLVSSPGSGKTTLLTRTINDLKAELKIQVIEGDQQTSNDAERIRQTGVKAIQINTGKGCHLDAHMIGHAIEDLETEAGSVLFIENVGNLVCPSLFDLGEAHKVVILSVTEGEDKPLKYPDMFYASDIMLLNKSDLLPYLDFDVDKCIENAKKINPRIKIITLSATKGEGMEQFYQWIRANHQIAQISNGAARSDDELAEAK